MGMVPPSFIPFRRNEAQPKDERPPLQGYGVSLHGEEHIDKDSNVREKLSKAGLIKNESIATTREQVVKYIEFGLPYYYTVTVAQLVEILGIDIREIHQLQGGVSLPVSTSIGEPSNPDLDIVYRVPTPRFDQRLIGEEHR